MAEQLKQLGDFFDPTKTGLQGLQLLQMQQHVAVQAQNSAVQAHNLELDNTRQAYLSANPMESYPAYAKLAELNGLPVPDVNTFYANPTMFDNMAKAEPGSEEYNKAFATLAKTDPRSRDAVRKEYEQQTGFRGARNLLGLAGIPPDNDTADFMRQSAALQGKVGEAVAQSPLQIAKQKQIEASVREHEETSANVNQQLGSLVPLMKTLGLQIERAAPNVEQLDALKQDYDRNGKSHGIMLASSKMKESIELNPDLKAFQDRRQQSIPKIQQAVQQLEDQQNQLETRAELVARGTAPLKEGESLAVLAGQIDASSHQLAYHRATLAFAQDPSRANLEALRTVKSTLDDTVQKLTDRKLASQESLDIRRDAQQETKQEHRLTRERVDNIGKAQVAWAESGSDPKAAYKFAHRFGVKVNEVLEGGKDPNKPSSSVAVTIEKEEKEEAKTVGKGFGEQYLHSQKAGMAATGKLAKLDRMESFLSGMTTGKLTPALTDIAAIGESFGITVDKTLPAKQALQSLSREIALELRNPSGGAGMPGAMSDQDREFLQSMTPGLAMTNEGNKLIIDTARKLAKRDQAIATLARTYRKNHGHLDEGFYDQVQSYGDANPLFARAAKGPAPQTEQPAAAPKAGTLSAAEQAELDRLRKKHGR